MKVSIIIPNYKGRNLLLKNLPFVLAAAKNPKNQVLEVIVVDDASDDGSVILLKDKFPSVKLIKHTVNRGFSAAVNTGVRGAKGELICLLNSDVIPKDNFLVSAISHFKENDVFAVSFHEDGYGWAKGFYVDGFVGHGPGGEPTTSHISFWASGGTALFSREIWMKLGGFDEKLLSPFYWEDIDLSYRAQKRGYKVLWDPDARVVHEHEATVRTLNKKYVDRIRERNQLLFMWKNVTSPTLTRRHLSGLIRRIVKTPGYLLIVFMALKRYSAVKRARVKEKRESVVSDEAILGSYK